MTKLSERKFSLLHSFQRPLLIVLDRNLDLATPFHHTWTYQALAHDVLVRLKYLFANDELSFKYSIRSLVDNEVKR